MNNIVMQRTLSRTDRLLEKIRNTGANGYHPRNKGERSLLYVWKKTHPGELITTQRGRGRTRYAFVTAIKDAVVSDVSKTTKRKYKKRTQKPLYELVRTKDISLTWDVPWLAIGLVASLALEILILVLVIKTKLP